MMLFLFIISFFFNINSMQPSTNSLGVISMLPSQLTEQMPLYIADVSKDANETVKSLIQLGRVNKYCNNLIKEYFTESEKELSRHMILYNKLFIQERWQHSKPAVFVLFGLKAIECSKKGIKTGNNIIWQAFCKEWFEYAVHANKVDIMLECSQPLSSSLCTHYRKGTPLLQVAIEKNNPQAVRQLLNLGANPKVGVTTIGAHGPEFMDLLTFAKQKGNQEIIKMLDNVLNPTNSVEEVALGEISLR